MPRHQVRYIHEARNDAEKGRLFAAARAGHISVLIGSTEKMGVGTNIQARAVALHLLDCPWRPSDQEQREGRILRQGNQNQEVQICRYVVEGSFDAYSWQTVERKARFINQVMRGRLDAREIEDIGDNTLSFAEVKALASGDPLILDKAHADAELTRLSRLERAWQRSRHTAAQHARAGRAARTRRPRAQIDEVSELLAHRSDTHGELFQITINGTAARAQTRGGAARPLGSSAPNPAPPSTIAQLGGLDILAKVSPDYRARRTRTATHPRRAPVEPARAPLDHAHANPLTLIRQLEHRVTTLDERRRAPPRRTPGRVLEEAASRAKRSTARSSTPTLTRPTRARRSPAHAGRQPARRASHARAPPADEPTNPQTSPSAPSPTRPASAHASTSTRPRRSRSPIAPTPSPRARAAAARGRRWPQSRPRPADGRVAAAAARHAGPADHRRSAIPARAQPHPRAPTPRAPSRSPRPRR